ncbi:MAG: dethiobiotin synthase [Candidatus Omnitrophica bacterium]|nr:dethiobiotin synthase [Candidatus Omnitrophota bacterium]
MRKKGVFIVGTDTGVGKTVFAAGLAMALREKNIRVGAMKPVATGCFSQGGKLYSSDAIYLFEAAQNEFPSLTCPVKFRNPLAPSVASEIEGGQVVLERIFVAYKELESYYDYMIVEGIEGLLVPFSGNYFVSDLARDLKLPIVIVARNALGTINHTLLTIEAAKERDLDIKGVILNGLPQTGFSITELTNPRVIRDLTGVPILGVLPRIPGVDVEKFSFGNLKDVFKENIDVDALL